MSKLRVAWFSPLNLSARSTSASVSAYASDLLLPELTKSLDIEIFHNSFDTGTEYQSYHYLSAYRRHRDNPFDVFFYQVEDQKSSNFIRVHMGLMPGMVWFHDLIFSSFGPEPILNSPWSLVVENFKGANIWPEHSDELPQFGPLGFREAAWAVQALFSNPVAHSEYRRSIHKKLVASTTETPSACLALPVLVESEVRPKNYSQLQIAFCGSPRIEQRAHKLLQALQDFPGAKLDWMLDQSELPQAQDLLREFNFEGCDFKLGRTPAAWRELVKKANIAFHCHFSVYGQADPYLAISMASGLASIVSDFGASDYLPDNLVFKVISGDSEAIQIQQILTALNQSKVLVNPEAIRNFIAQRHSVKTIAAELLSCFTAAAQQQRLFRLNWEAFEKRAKKILLQEAKNCLPAGLKDDLRHDCWQRITEVFLKEFSLI